MDEPIRVEPLATRGSDERSAEATFSIAPASSVARDQSEIKESTSMYSSPDTTAGFSLPTSPIRAMRIFLFPFG